MLALVHIDVVAKRPLALLWTFVAQVAMSTLCASKARGPHNGATWEDEAEEDDAPGLLAVNNCLFITFPLRSH